MIVTTTDLWRMSAMQLAGGGAAMTSNSAAVSARVSVAQVLSPVTVCVKAAASALMQAEYSATVAVQVVGMSLQPGLSAQGSVWLQEVSLFVQFVCACASDGALLDAA